DCAWHLGELVWCT
nr:Chain C, Fc-III peptide [synthetic construct]5DJ0_C Chain C, Fc-III peptide [synthetic construct]5DJ2_C Chain C, Fc-III peptide [synthetic construct]5DJ6_C Chain C, Fc-III peptide [synthetic construct]5DJ8_C Chain C, Fc-III peptide [synthetic construct]5DJA_C Chain C, Fc-III peptide [synthetic construct]5DJC_C Chain C, Fc-III peptide [synthetic construct]5DJC_F Chain F, Fc-III peptide [synthetic construct]5DJD_C Chain C, Fc-III peptide [synthetic construct]5DJX_C Chain C, Fc-III peptide